MVTWCRTALLLAMALPGEAGAQYAPPVPRPISPLRSLFEHSDRALTPSFALVGRNAELGLDGIMSWEEAADRPGVSIRLGAFGRRFTRSSWGGAGAGLAYRIAPGATRLWIGVDGTAGAGNGPRQAIAVRAGGRLGQVSLEFRSAWWQGAGIGVDSLGHATPVSVTSSSRHTEAEVNAAHRLGRVSLEAVGGVRFGDQETQDEWGSLTLATSVRREVDLFASLGSRPKRPDRGGLPGRYLQIGIRLQAQPTGAAAAPPLLPPAPAPRFQVERREGDAWVLTLQFPSARSVELAGDLTEWTSVPLVRSRGEPTIWRTTVHAAPGVYHIALRIDHGPWWAPPGLAAVPDGYNGLAGLLELR